MMPNKLPPTPAPTASSESRRSGQKSEEIVSSRGPFGVLVGFRRVGTPKLRPLPLKTFIPGSVLMGLLRSHSISMQHAIRDILIQNGLPQASFDDDPDGFEIQICDRYEPQDREGTRESTIYVTAPWNETSTNTWYAAAKELKVWADGYLDSHDMKHVNISIEIIWNDLVRKKYMTVVAPRQDWLQGWATVQGQIHDILQSYESAKNNWNCVALINFGPNVPPASNPTTVYISFDHACDEGLIAKAIRPAIQAYLDLTPFGWQLHIEHSISDSYAFTLQPPSTVNSKILIQGPYQQKIDLGANISASNYVQSTDGRTRNPMIGTLGCYVQVKIKDRWELFGLTNYHVVRHAFQGAQINPDNAHAPPAVDSPLYLADHHGFSPNQFPQMMVESPSRTSHNATMAHHPDAVTRRLAKEQDKAIKLRFFDEGKHIMGSLWAGSGFARRTKDGGVLDWALIKIKDERVGRNILPTTDAWPYGMGPTIIPPEKIWGKELHGSAPTGLTSESPAFKYGVISKGTTGLFSEYHSNVITTERRYMAKEDPVRYGGTVELYFIPVRDEYPFAEPGDSGSIVYNGEGQALGLLFRGNPGRNLTYITPIHHVFDDIKRSLKGMVTDVRIAVFPPRDPKSK